MHQLLNLCIWHHGQNATGPDAGVVNQSIKGSEFLSQLFNKTANAGGIGEIKRPEIECARFVQLRFSEGRSELLALVPRYRDDSVAICNEFARDAEPQSPAST